MSDVKREISRAKMSARERDLRSRLAKLLHSAGILRGTLNVRERVCGKPNCKCARGQKHVALYVVASESGKQRQLFVPKAWQDDVRQWVQNHQEVRKLMEEISQLYWWKVQKRES